VCYIEKIPHPRRSQHAVEELDGQPHVSPLGDREDGTRQRRVEHIYGPRLGSRILQIAMQELLDNAQTANKVVVESETTNKQEDNEHDIL
jgi:hypothetical protein